MDCSSVTIGVNLCILLVPIFLSLDIMGGPAPGAMLMPAIPEGAELFEPESNFVITTTTQSHAHEDTITVRDVRMDAMSRADGCCGCVVGTDLV